MAKKYIELSKYPGDMTPAELRAALGSVTNARVMRSLLMAEVKAVEGGAKRETRTIRSLWYSLIKPALSRLGILDKKTKPRKGSDGGKSVDWAGLLSSHLADLVRMGYTSYRKLSIVDGSRQRAVAHGMERHIIDPVDLVGAHYPWVILFTEKDTIWGEVRNIASLYGVSAISGKGQPSFACTENTVQAITESDVYQGQAITVLSLTDYDPAGYSIANSQFAQVQEMARARDVRHVRLGLLPEQLTAEERQKNSYKPGKDGLARWYAKTGGVDGQMLGLELDALPMSRLREMFARGIEQHVNLDKRRDDLHNAYVDLIACELLRPDFDAQRAALQAGIKQSVLWDDITNTSLPKELFRRAASLGMNSIDPLQHNLFECADKVREKMRNVME